MIYFKWFLMLPMSFLMTLVGFVIAPILPFFAKDGWLPSWLSWFQTPDNSLDGDNGWKTEHWLWRYKLPEAICSYVGRVGWLWRNPTYGYGLVILENPERPSFVGNDKVNDNPGVEGSCLVNGNGLFQFVFVKKITATKCFYLNCGWNIKGLIGDLAPKHLATYVVSPRITTFK